MNKISEIKLVPINELYEHPRNPNKHSKEQIDRLAELIKYQGVRLPIIVSNLSGKIVAGHGRKLAYEKLGFKEVPVSYQDFENEDQEYAFMISDNAIASWSDLDLGMINFELCNFNPNFNLEMFGLEKEFKVDPSEKEEKKSFRIYVHCESKEKQQELVNYLVDKEFNFKTKDF